MQNDSLQQLADIDWASVLKRLTLFAKHRLGSRGSFEDAEELAREAVSKLLKPSNMNKLSAFSQTEVLEKLGSIVNGDIQNNIRKKSFKTERLATTEDEHRRIFYNENRLIETPTAEDTIIQRERTQGVLRKLEARFVGNELIESIYLLFLDGVETAREQSRNLGVDVVEIYKARRCLDGHIKAIKKQLSEEGHDDEKRPRSRSTRSDG